MKNHLLTLLLFIPFFGTAQHSFFAEFSLDPFQLSASDNSALPEPQTVVKDLSLGTCYDLRDYLTLNLGYSRLDPRNVTSSQFFQDNFVDGDPSFLQGLSLSHSPEITSHSIFTGASANFSRFHMEVNVGYALGVFGDELIKARESDTFTGLERFGYFPIDYKNITFFTGEIKLAYDVLSSVDGSLAIVVKYKKEFSDDLGIEVKSYDSEVREMVENFPGSTFFDIDEFLQRWSIKLYS
jgi:hypothetical protein